MVHLTYAQAVYTLIHRHAGPLLPAPGERAPRLYAYCDTLGAVRFRMIGHSDCDDTMLRDDVIEPVLLMVGRTLTEKGHHVVKGARGHVLP